MAVVLFVCTGNLCRSPSAEMLLAQRLSEVGPSDVTVESAGTSGTTATAPSELLQEGAVYGLDLGAHVPRGVDTDLVARADLVIGMERAHVREIVQADPPTFVKTFTLREFVRRGTQVGPRRPRQPLTEWLEQISAGRRHVELMGDSPVDDVPDPMGGSSEDYRIMLTGLATQIRVLHSLVWPDNEMMP